jgi:1,2-diacylglycerol 3-beta-galactosyltransferase
VTKAGPGTIAEAAALGLPVLLAGHLPGQEAGNGAAVVRVGSGLEASSTRDLVARVDELSTHPELMRRLRTGARRSGRPRAAALAAGLIHQLLEANR